MLIYPHKPKNLLKRINLQIIQVQGLTAAVLQLTIQTQNTTAHNQHVVYLTFLTIAMLDKLDFSLLV